jgi:membrane glycosyltransferase
MRAPRQKQQPDHGALMKNRRFVSIACMAIRFETIAGAVMRKILQNGGKTPAPGFDLPAQPQ